MTTPKPRSAQTIAHDLLATFATTEKAFEFACDLSMSAGIAAESETDASKRRMLEDRSTFWAGVCDVIEDIEDTINPPQWQPEKQQEEEKP
jgi:hypothetical protein